MSEWRPMRAWPRVAFLWLAAIGAAAPVAAQSPGQAVFTDRCAACHRGDDPRIPAIAVLRQRTPEFIVEALTTGIMRQQGAELSAAERAAVAAFITGRSVSTNAGTTMAGRCSANGSSSFSLIDGPSWTGWGPNATNARFQTDARAGLTAEQIPKLKLKWAFGFPGATSARAQPTVAGGRVFVGSQDGTVYALDAKSGCTYWAYKAKASVRSAITLGPGFNNRPTAYFGDGRSAVYALDAATGELLWTRTVDEHPSSHVTGAPTLHENRLYVSVASGEEGQGNTPRYECCTFRGSVVALNIANGNVVWKTYTIPQEPRTIGRNAGGTVRWGPSGAGIWSSPTIDPKRRVVYAATGNMYTEPQQNTSDAVIAFDMDTGKIAWISQVTAKDVFVVGCNQPAGANCPERSTLGPDFDFGNAPMLTTLPNGRDLIVIGQKSADGWALDPDRKGAIVWKYRAGNGSALGGMEFGSATDGVRAYFPLADGNQPTAGEMHAVDLATGAPAWKTVAPPVLCGERGRGCSPAILAAISVIPAAVFAGSNDGGFRAYSTATGEVIWQFDTNRDFTTVNGVAAKGASISGPGPAIAGGMVYVNSGYGALGGRPGNVLLAFGVEE